MKKKCPDCNGKLIIGGYAKSGNAQYFCKVCQKKFTLTGFIGGRRKVNHFCSICGGVGYSKGLCQKHYRQERKKQK